MTERTTYSSASETIPPEGFFDQYAARIKTLMDAATFPLTSTGGTADEVTATLDPVLDSDGFADGMTFSIVWGAANTDAVTLAINGATALAVLDKAGNALAAGALASGLHSLLEYRGGALYCLSDVLTIAGEGSYYFAFTDFTETQTFTKPTNLSDTRMILVEMWGGGGGGGNASGPGGGGGGAYSSRWYPASAVGATEDVVVGAGGGPFVNGGASSFGALLTAAGGSRGTGTGGGNGGGHGPSNTIGRGAGGSGDADGGDATTLWGGGGGGGDNGNDGGDAVFGGAGGGGSGGSGGNGGGSSFGGNGGDNGNAGSDRGGGGGANAAGGRGEVRVIIA